MPPAAYRGGENSVSVSWPGASKPRRAAGGWFSSECDKIGSSPRCSRGWHEHRRSTYNNGSHAGRASTCAMNPQAISRARRRLCGGRAKSLTLSRRPGAATLPVVTEVSPSQVYGARLLSGFGASTPSRVQISPPPPSPAGRRSAGSPVRGRCRLGRPTAISVVFGSLVGDATAGSSGFWSVVRDALKLATAH